MKTQIHPDLQNLPEVQAADDILRRCVHCGFCTATCPTYQLTGDELDGPRGRIYLIKNLLEVNDITLASAEHLDRCLTCRACETTCPSGVEYGSLLDVGRTLAHQRVAKPLAYRSLAALLRLAIPRAWIFRPALRLGQWFKPFLPRALGRYIPRRQRAKYPMVVRDQSAARKVVLLSGCVQSAATPNVTAALSHILAQQGVAAEIVEEGCCGSLDLHLSAAEKARERMKGVIDLLTPLLDSCEAVVSTATGCAVTISEYPEIFRDDPVYLARAESVAAKLTEPMDLIKKLGLKLTLRDEQRKVAVHIPCTMQHGMKRGGSLEDVVRDLGFHVVGTREQHLCCGSAGTYSMLQPELSEQLRANKIKALIVATPDIIVTANVGCQLHLDDKTRVMHWLELVAENC